MSNDSKPLLNKVSRFFAGSAFGSVNTDSQSHDTTTPQISKSEIKAMIKRKNHNDLIRKRELAMLRNIRHNHGNSSSNTHGFFSSEIDSVLKISSQKPNSDLAVKAKIDAIERQMVGGAPWSDTNNTEGLEATHFQTVRKITPFEQSTSQNTSFINTEHHSTQLIPQALVLQPDVPQQNIDTSSQATSEQSQGSLNPDINAHFRVRDVELDAPVISFANANFDLCEQQLIQLIESGAVRHGDIGAWMTLFDLYRVLDMHNKFDTLALSFSIQFNVYSPKWYSLPKLVAEHLQLKSSLNKETPDSSFQSDNLMQLSVEQQEINLPKTIEGWVAPAHLNEETISSLQIELLQMAQPWALDWTGVKSINAQAAHELTVLIKNWSNNQESMTWIGINKLIKILEESTPSGSRSIDPVFWMLRLELLRLCNLTVHFDEVAIDYCITFEQSPPSWEASNCKINLLEDALCTQITHFTHISDVSTYFVESQIFEDTAIIELASLELSGQLLGNIESTLLKLENQLGNSTAISIDCSYLIRVDFVAAGNLLNWVLKCKAEHRSVEFINPHRLIALFFGAMGITDHAQIQIKST